MAPLKIAIIGAGPAGSTLALILHNAGIEATIFESEPNANARNQGGTLDLHDNTGLLAIKRAGLWDTFTKQCRYDGEAMIASNKYLRRYLNLPGATEGSSRGRPEIDRTVLRQMLVDALPASTVRWNHHLKNVDDCDPTKITLHFRDGTTYSGFDLLVGAEGAWSKVRSLVTYVKPFYAGMSMIRYTISDVKTRCPDLHDLVNRGSLFAFSDGKAILAQQLGDGSLSTSAVRLTPEEFLKNLPYDSRDGKASKEHSLSYFRDWDPRLRKLIEVADDTEPWYGNICSLPVGTRWAHRPGITLIGDAAHALVPWAGEGVNLSLEDSVKLADAIIAASQTASEKGTVSKEVLSAKVQEYEEDMFVRAKKTSEMSYDMMNAMFYETGAPDLTVEKYVTVAMGDAVPWWAVPVLSVVVSTYFRWFRWWYPGLGDIHKKTK
ncbi:Kynurenine 3-monooxygenase [Elsinoe australis]|uniref:Kynurenine 3-monooxygenase n=1 Tax=Elsinoe australis TaxID=40998 RepID=A0A2P8A1K4_9PEZI|nr:Kynurenine 3-monooxygenase [Elsinoe australis]